MNPMADQPQPIPQDVEPYLAAQARGEPAPPAVAARTSTKAKRQKKGPPAPHFGALAKEARANSSLPSKDIDGLLAEAEQALASVNSPNEPGHPPVKPFYFHDFAAVPGSTQAASLELIREVELDLKIELGRTQMYLEDVLKLRNGSVVPLDKLAGDPVDIIVNGRLIARGEVLVLDDNFCVRVTELIP
jgi:flagellar motor switch protein FliN/FliY